MFSRCCCSRLPGETDCVSGDLYLLTRRRTGAHGGQVLSAALVVVVAVVACLLHFRALHNALTWAALGNYNRADICLIQHWAVNEENILKYLMWCSV